MQKTHVGDAHSIPRSGRSLEEGSGNLLQYSCLRIPWTGESGRLHSMGCKELASTDPTCTFIFRFQGENDCLSFSHWTKTVGLVCYLFLKQLLSQVNRITLSQTHQGALLKLVVGSSVLSWKTMNVQGAAPLPSTLNLLYSPLHLVATYRIYVQRLGVT